MRHFEPILLLLVAIIGVLLLVVAACSTTAERFDDRPDICRDLGKRGLEC